MSNISNVSTILKDLDFRFNKQYGQNFITDTNLLNAIVEDSGITSDDVVIEIGAGAGTLTRAIAAVAKKVIAFEIDNNLKPVLDLTMQGIENVEVVFRDIMKVTDDELREIVGGDYKVVANLPYYITTPIIMRFLESDYKPQSLSIMVQKEVAERMVAKPNTEDYGSITAVVDLYANTEITRIVGRNMFFPVPKVDSAVIRLDIVPDKYDCDITAVKKIIKGAFAMRRKTLVNNMLSLGFSRKCAENSISGIGLDIRVRGEVLGVPEFIALNNLLIEGKLKDKMDN